MGTQSKPEPGFYYHFKHEDSKGLKDYAYEILNIGHHTEIDGLEESAMVVYRPLYEDAGVYKAGKAWDVRPLKKFMEPAIKDGQTVPRFSKINDEQIIRVLTMVRGMMYK